MRSLERNRRIQRITQLGIVAGMICILQVGCGGPFEMAKASGTIKTEGGENLPNGILTFTPIAMNAEGMSGKPAYAEIENGKFIMSTYGEGDGAVVGKHKVTLTETWRDDEEYIEDKSQVPPRHGCIIAPDFEEIEVFAGKENIFELTAVRKTRRDVNEEMED